MNTLPHRLSLPMPRRLIGRPACHAVAREQAASGENEGHSNTSASKLSRQLRS